MRALFFAVLAMLPLAAGAQGVSAADRGQADRGQVDQAVVDRALAYLNAARVINARFIQRDQHGGRWTGQMWVARPGQLRFQYDPPENDVIWSNGFIIKHFDAELETVTQVPRDMTPAWFLLDEHVRIKEDVQVLATAEQGGRYFVTATQTGVLNDGRVTLAFETSPARLLGWAATDGDGEVIQVDLVDLKVGGVIPDEVFKYQPPIPENGN